MSRGACASSVAAMLIGCSSPTDIDFALDASTKGVVSAVVLGSAASVTAIDPDAERTWRSSFLRDGAAELVVLQYDRTLDELDMVPGELRRVIDDEVSSQLLPDPARIDLRIASSTDDGTWTTVDDLPQSLVGFRFKRTTARECLEGGGCYDNGRCVTPCPPPPTPEPPAPPEPPDMNCPDGWATLPPEASGDAERCDPYPPNGFSERCARGEQHLPGTAGCAPLGATCPAGPFPNDAPASAIFVRRGATGGDGTRGSPYGTVTAALADAMAGDTIVVAVGTYRETFNVRVPLTIRGACPSTTIIGDPNAVVGVTITATVTLRDIAIEGRTAVNVQQGDLTFDGVHLEGSVFTGLQVSGGRALGRGVHVSTAQTGIRNEGGVVDLEDVTIVDAGGFGVSGIGPSPVTLTNFAIDGTGSSAIAIGEGAALTLTRGTLRGFGFRGIQFTGAATVMLADVVFRDSVSSSAPATYVTTGVELVGDRITIENMNGAGLSVVEGNAVLRDLVVRNTRSQIGSGQYGNGVEVSEGGQVTIERGVVYESRGVGVLSAGPGSLASLSDVAIVETRGWEVDGERGTNLNAFQEATIEIERVHLLRGHGFGIVAELSSAVRGTDLRVEDTLPRDANQAYGRGVELSNGGQLEVIRAHFESNRSVAVYALDPGTFVSLEDVVMTKTTESACFMFSCNVGLADGMTVILSARAVVDRFAIIDNEQYGLRIANAPDLTMRDGVIRGNAVGVQSVSEGFDFAAIAEGVLVEGNETPFSILID